MELTITLAMKLQKSFCVIVVKKFQNTHTHTHTHTHTTVMNFTDLIKYYHLMKVCIYASLAQTTQVRNYLHDS